MFAETMQSDAELARRLQAEEDRKDGDRRNLSISTVIKERVSNVLTKWRKSNKKFIPPVVATKDALIFRLQIALETICDISRRRAKNTTNLEWDSKLDKLLGMTVCQCSSPSNTFTLSKKMTMSAILAP